MDPEFDRLRLLGAEQAADAARAQTARQERDRAAGVAWSGLTPEPFPIRDASARAADAAARLAALESWRASCPGRLLAAMVQAERAVETVRTCVARGLALSDARCGLALGDLERAACAARAAMDEPMDASAPGALSGDLCATSIASSSRSIGSPRSSAG